MSSDITAKVGYGPLNGLPQHISNTDLDTTAIDVTPDIPQGTNVNGHRIKIKNGSATANIAWTISKAADTSSAITADYAATSGSIIGPGESEFIPVTSLATGQYKLWIVASAAATEYNVTYFGVS